MPKYEKSIDFAAGKIYNINNLFIFINTRVKQEKAMSFTSVSVIILPLIALTVFLQSRKGYKKGLSKSLISFSAVLFLVVKMLLTLILYVPGFYLTRLIIVLCVGAVCKYIISGYVVRNRGRADSFRSAYGVDYVF